MKFVTMLIVAFAITGLSAAGAMAQEPRNPPAKNGATNPQSSGSNVSGSTGFTGWSRDAAQGGTTGAQVVGNQLIVVTQTSQAGRFNLLVYALACFRAGAEQVEVVYHFLERPDSPVEAVFTQADVPELEAELSAAIARIQAGEFPPTPSDFACAGCPAFDLVCAGPRLRPRLPEAVAS